VRSLTVKLVLAFFATSIAGVALAALFVRQSVTREFEDYVVTQQRASFIDDVTGYYQTTGSWAGVGEWLRDAAPGRQQPPPQNAAPEPLHFALADTAGRIVIPNGEHRPGEVMNQADLSSGVPVTSSGRFVGTVLTPKRAFVLSPAEERYLSRTDQAHGIAAAVMICVALGLGVLFARRITRPVHELTTATRKIAEGDLDQRVRVRSKDELGLLAEQFNNMSADLSRATALRRQMTADIAHDLRTPLTVVSGYLEALRDRVLEPTPERFAIMHDEVQALLHLVEDLHTLSLADSGELLLDYQDVAPQQLLERVAGTYKHAADREGVELRVESQEAGQLIRVDVEQISRVLSNLVSNALRYTPRGGRISLIARTDSNHAELVVTDTGTGIAPEHLPNIFERSYRADKSREQGTGDSGLGLAIVKSIVEAHKGRVSVDSTPGAGTAFRVALPLS
jgi:signal transduction histidine kinase